MDGVDDWSYHNTVQCMLRLAKAAYKTIWLCGAHGEHVLRKLPMHAF